jgi:S1-C subfamily serine protease
VVPDSPAARAGLRPGDIIQQLAGREIKSANDLLAAVRAAQVGRQVTLRIHRGSDALELQVTPSNRP